MMIEKMRQAFPEEEFPGDNGFYSGYMDRWQDIYEGRPKWREVKRAGLNRGTVRQMNMLNTAKILCDEFSHKCFAEQVDITCGSEVMTHSFVIFYAVRGSGRTFHGFSLRHLLRAAVF